MSLSAGDDPILLRRRHDDLKRRAVLLAALDRLTPLRHVRPALRLVDEIGHFTGRHVVVLQPGMADRVCRQGLVETSHRLANGLALASVDASEKRADLVAGRANSQMRPIGEHNAGLQFLGGLALTPLPPGPPALRSSSFPMPKG